MDPQPALTEAGVLTSEMDHLKSEQRQRIQTRDNLLYASLASSLAASLGTFKGHPVLLLLLPPVCFVLGWSHLMNDHKTSAIGQYIRTTLIPRFHALTTPNTPDTELFGWETAHRSDHRRTSRKIIQLAADLTPFVVAPLAALAVYWSTTTPSTPLLTVSVIELLVIAVLAQQIVVYADFRKE